MEELSFITHLEDKLRATISLRQEVSNPLFWTLQVRLFYDGEAAGTTSFKLNGYTQAEAEHLARHLGEHPYLMREIDEYLWGESD